MVRPILNLIKIMLNTFVLFLLTLLTGGLLLVLGPVINMRKENEKRKARERLAEVFMEFHNAHVESIIQSRIDINTRASLN